MGTVDQTASASDLASRNRSVVKYRESFKEEAIHMNSLNTVTDLSLSRRTVLGGMFAVAAVPLLASCTTSGEGSGTTELRVGWWGDDTRHEATQAALDLFTKKNPDVTIGAEYGGYENYFEKLSTQLAGRKAPDLVQMSVDGYPALADKGVLLDLNELVDSGVLDLSSFDAEVLKQGERDGKQVTLPMGLSAPIVLTDNTKLNELGIEFDSTDGFDGYAKTALAISEATPDGYWGSADGGGYRGFLETWVRQDGGLFFTEGGELGFTKKQLSDHFGYWGDLRSKGAAVSAGEQAVFQENLDGLPLIRGIAALDASFVTIFAGLSGMVTNELGFGAMPYDDPSNSGQAPTFGVSFSIIATTDHKEATGKLLDFLINDEAAVTALGFTRGVTPSPAFNAIAAAGLSDEELMAKGITYIDSLAEFAAPAPAPLPPRAGEIQQALLRRINEEISFGRLTISEGVDNFFSEANSILEK